MTVTLYDSITPSAIPSDAVAVAGYVGGNWPDFSLLAARFPRARHKSIAVNASEDADILDIENGDAVPGEAAGWVRRQLARGVKRPGLYANASTMPSVQGVLAAAGIARSLYVLWVAAWDGSATILAGFEAHQYIDHGPRGENYDLSVADDAFWSGPSPPASNPQHYDWFATGPFPSKWGPLNERLVVERYDGARKFWLKYRLYLNHKLRAQLKFLANRVYYEAHLGKSPTWGTAPAWGVDHRGWRFQQLVHRSQGQRFA